MDSNANHNNNHNSDEKGDQTDGQTIDGHTLAHLISNPHNETIAAGRKQSKGAAPAMNGSTTTTTVAADDHPLSALSVPQQTQAVELDTVSTSSSIASSNDSPPQPPTTPPTTSAPVVQRSVSVAPPPLQQRVTYLGCVAINAPRSEAEIQRNMAILNDSPSAMDITLIVPKSPDECVQMYELVPDSTPIIITAGTGDESNAGDATNGDTSGPKLMGQFPIARIIFCARGKQESNERMCFAFTASHGSTFETGVIKCHVFRCLNARTVAEILEAFGLAFRRVPTNTTTNQDINIIVESGLEIKEDTADGKSNPCPRDKECFKFKANAEKKICIAIFQDSTQSRVTLNIEKCFGMLLSPGRNIKSSDMIPIGLLSMTKHTVPTDNNRKVVTQWQIIGAWNPTEPLFEVLNSETPRDTRVYFTIAVDLVVQGIQEPIRFVFEAKAKIVTTSAADRFWINIPTLSKGKPFHEQFHVQLRERVNSEPNSRFDVVSCFSATQLSHQRHKLALRLRHDGSQQPSLGDRRDSHRSSVTSLPTPSNDESEDNDEPLPSGTGVVSKECTQTELDGWSELLIKWHQNLTLRPKQVQTLVKRGIPEALRGEVWQLLAGCQDEVTLMEQYRALINRESPYEKYIERDINRTFPAHEFFKESGSLGQDSLFKLCKAYSNYDTEIGYCQGLSFLIASLLLHMPEEQAFCVLVKIMNEYGLRNLFRNGFEELQLKFYQLERAMDSVLPELYSHFADLGVEAHMYASQWFLTLFTAKFPLHVVFPILDLFLLDGMDTIFQVALALLSISKKDLLALDFEGVLKYFRVSLPKKFRTEENGKYLLRTAVAIKLKKLKKYEKEYQIWKESTKVENPIDRLEKENKRLVDSTLRLEQENDDLAQELLTTCNSKIRLRADLDKVEDKADTLSTELLTTRSLLVDVEDEKRRLEDEVKCLKEMCRRELERAESEIGRNTRIITEYKQICSQLQSRFESEQSSARESLAKVLDKVRDCDRCGPLVDDTSVAIGGNEMNGGDSGADGVDGSATGLSNHFHQKIAELESELVKSKVALVESECRNEELILQLNSAQTEISQMRAQNDESKNTWLSKTLSSIRDVATKPSATVTAKTPTTAGDQYSNHSSIASTPMSRDVSRDFANT